MERRGNNRINESRQSTSLGGVLCNLAILAIGGLYVAKVFKEELKAREKEVENNNWQGEGIIDSNSAEEKTVVTKNLVKGILKDPDWDLEILDTNGALCNPEKTVHVRQLDEDTMEILLGFPTNLKGDIPAYMRQLNDYSFEIKNMLNLRKIERSLVGYYRISYKILGEEEEKFEYIEISREDYEKYSDRFSNGLTNLVEVINKKKETRLSLSISAREGIEDLKIKGAVLYYRMEIPIKNRKFPGLEGIYKTLKYIIGNLEIELPGKLIKYEYLMFHAENEYGKEDLSYFYDIDSEGDEISVSYEEF